MRDDLRVEKARDGQDTAGQPDESDGDPGDAFTHPRTQRMNNGDVPDVYLNEEKNSQFLYVYRLCCIPV